jgi:hypothetical protein
MTAGSFDGRNQHEQTVIGEQAPDQPTRPNAPRHLQRETSVPLARPGGEQVAMCEYGLYGR